MPSEYSKTKKNGPLSLVPKSPSLPLRVTGQGVLPGTQWASAGHTSWLHVVPAASPSNHKTAHALPSCCEGSQRCSEHQMLLGGQGASERSHRWPAGLLRGSSADSSQQRRHLEPGASSGMRAVLKGPLYNWLQSSICGLFMELKNSVHTEAPQPVLGQTAGCPHRWAQQAHHGS